MLGLLFITAALLLSGYNYREALQAEKASEDVARQLQDHIMRTLEEQGENDAQLDYSDYYASDYNDTDELSSGILEYEDEDRTMEVVEINGYDYIGVLEIPSLGLTLPVMEEWDYTRLKTSPCRYSGSYYANNLVIAGHNYARHFSPIKWIAPGSDIYFTNPSGDRYHYQVDYIETLSPEKTEEMTSGDWDLTLFTCTTGGGARCAVRCSRVNNGDR